MTAIDWVDQCVAFLFSVNRFEEGTSPFLNRESSQNLKFVGIGGAISYLFLIEYLGKKRVKNSLKVKIFVYWPYLQIESGIFQTGVGLSQHTNTCQLARRPKKILLKQCLEIIDGYFISIPMLKIYTIPIK